MAVACRGRRGSLGWLCECLQLVVQASGMSSAGEVKDRMRAACVGSKTLLLATSLTSVLLALAQPSPPDLPGTSSWEGVWSEVHVTCRQRRVDRDSCEDV